MPIREQAKEEIGIEGKDDEPKSPAASTSTNRHLSILNNEDNIQRRSSVFFRQQCADKWKRFTLGEQTLMLHKHKSSFTLLYLCAASIVIIGVLLCAGGMVFYLTEYKHYKDLIHSKKENDLLLKNFHQQYNVSNEYLEALEQQIKYSKIRDDNPWTFYGAIYYSATLVSTIGFGFYCPKTSLGDDLTVCYCFIGIPIFLYSSFQYTCCWLTPLAAALEKKGMTDQMTSLCILWTMNTIVMWVITLLIEVDWSPGNSLYFVLQTGFTVALGDLEPKETWSHLEGFILCNCFTMFIGTSMMLIEVITRKAGDLNTKATDTFEEKVDGFKRSKKLSDIVTKWKNTKRSVFKINQEDSNSTIESYVEDEESEPIRSFIRVKNNRD